MARQIKPIFTEVVAAPAFEEEAVQILSAKKNLRLLVVEPPARGGYEIKQVTGRISPFLSFSGRPEPRGLQPWKQTDPVRTGYWRT